MRHIKQIVFTSLLGVSFLVGGLPLVLCTHKTEIREASAASYDQIIDGTQYYEYDSRSIGQQYFTLWTNNGFPKTNVEQWHTFSENDQCWVRYVVDVASEGDYRLFFKIGVTGNKNARFYVNNNSEIAITDYSGSGVDNQATAHFNQGLNVFLVEMIWNNTEYKRLLLPESFTPVSLDTNHTYYGMNANSRGLKLNYESDYNNLFNPNYILEPDFFYPNGMTETASYATITPDTQMIFTVNEAQESEYFVHTLNSSGSTNKSLVYSIDGGSESTVTVLSGQTETFQKISLGILSAGSHTIMFRQNSDGARRLKVQKITAESSETSLVSIDSISGTLSGIKNDSWDFSNLTVIGTYDDYSSADITGLCEFTVNSPSLDNSGSGNNASVTVSVDELNKTFTNVNYVIRGITTLTPTQIRQQVDVQGRSIFTDEYLTMDWGLSSLEFNIVGGGDIVVNYNLLQNDNNTKFAVEIDGELSEFISLSAGEHSAKVASDLSSSAHNVKIIKTSQASGNLLNVTGLQIFDEAVLSKPQARDLNIEIIGDSFAAGETNLNSGQSQNAYYGFANVLRKAFNANLNLVATNGIGLTAGYIGGSASREQQMEDIYDYQCYYRDANTEIDASKYVPDVIVISLGNNDLGEWIMSMLGHSINDFTNSVGAFNAKLHNYYPSAKIIWAYGGFINRKYVSEFKTAVEAASYASFVYMSKIGGTSINVDDHPTIDEHKQIADYIATEIAKVLNDGIATQYQMQNPLKQRYMFESELHANGGNSSYNDGGNWSNGYGLANLGSDNYIEINIGFTRSSKYTIRVGGATNGGGNVRIYVDDELVKDFVMNTGNWCPSGVCKDYNDATNIEITKGNHSIKIYGPNNGGWVNHDYIEIFEGDPLACETFYQKFMADTGLECSTSVSTRSFSYAVWNNLKTEFLELDEDNRDMLVSSYSDLLERYELIITNYHGLDNYLVDGSDNHVFSFTNINDTVNTDSNITLIMVVTTSISMIAFALLVLRRKRNEE